MTSRSHINRQPRKRILSIAVALLLLPLVAAILSIWGQWRQDDLNYRLIQSIKRHQTNLTISLLNKGASANAQDAPRGSTEVNKLVTDVWMRLRGTKPPKNYYPSALMLACIVNIDPHARLFTMHRDVPPMYALLSHGADPNSAVQYGETALDVQISAGDAEVVKLMLDHGAQANRTIRMSPLLSAVLANRVDIARLLLEHGGDVRARTTVADRDWAPGMPIGVTLLHHAAIKSRRHRIQMLDLLLTYGADINAQDSAGRTPMMWASIEAGPEVVPWLLGHGANASLRDNNGQTALYYVKCWPDSPDKRAIARLLRQTEAVKGVHH